MTSLARLPSLTIPIERAPGLIQLRRVRAKPAHSRLRVGDRRGDRLVDLMGDRGRRLPMVVTRLKCVSFISASREASAASSCPLRSWLITRAHRWRGPAAEAALLGRPAAGPAPAEIATDDAARELSEFACKAFNIIHLICHSRPYELSSKDYESLRIDARARAERLR